MKLLSTQKTFIFVMLLLLVSNTKAQGHDTPEPIGQRDIGTVLARLQSQSEKLEQQPMRKCESNYESIFSKTKPDVRLSLFYGYTDSNHTVSDGGFALAMTQQLQKPCSSLNIQSCGFKLEKSVPGSITLIRKLIVQNEEKTIHLTIASSSLTWNDDYNRDLQKGYWDQKKRTDEIEKNFHEALKDSEVVFYSGHARLGGGPGFSPTTLLTGTLEAKKRDSFRKVIAGLRSTQSQLKFLGYFACESEKYYAKEIVSAAPSLGLIVTEKEINAFDSEQSTLGALNSILSRKCEAEFAEALIPVSHPNQNVTKLQNFFKQAEIPNKSSTSNLKSSSLQ